MPYKDPERQKQHRREYYRKHREQSIEYSKRYYKENREKVRRYAKKRYEENKEDIKRKVREYGETHKKECLERANRWRKNNPEKRKAICKRYYIKKKKEDPEYFNRQRKRGYYLNVEESRKKLREYRRKNPIKTRYWKYNRRARCNFSGVDKEHMTEEFRKGVLKKLKEQNYRCIYCGKDIRNNYSIDHIIPLSKGGTNEIENIDLVCKSCNTRKGTRSKEEFSLLLGLED